MCSSPAGIKDVVPSPTEYGGYESFEVLIEKTNDWLRDQSDVAIINMQSLMVQRNDGQYNQLLGILYIDRYNVYRQLNN